MTRSQQDLLDPLALVGRFAFVKTFGFRLNQLTLFGLMLATGLVVDDAFT